MRPFRPIHEQSRKSRPLSRVTWYATRPARPAHETTLCLVQWPTEWLTKRLTAQPIGYDWPTPTYRNIYSKRQDISQRRSMRDYLYLKSFSPFGCSLLLVRRTPTSPTTIRARVLPCRNKEIHAKIENERHLCRSFGYPIKFGGVDKPTSETSVTVQDFPSNSEA